MGRWSVVLVLALGCQRTEPPGSAPAARPPGAPVVAAKPSLTRHQPTHSLGKEKQYQQMPVADPWPVGPFDIARELPLAIGAGPFGTAHRVIRAIADPSKRWALLCQQRHDSDGDGTIKFEQDFHFSLGDKPYPYFAIGGGPGTEIEEVVAVSKSGDHLVLRLDHATVLFDMVKRTGEVLPGAQTAADFSTDGRYLFYVDETENKGQIVQRNLVTGWSRIVLYPSGAGSVIAGATARWVFVSPYSDLQSHYEWCDLGGSRGPSYEKRAFVDLDTGAVASDPSIVWPLGDRMLTRSKTKLALGGTPIGPTDCKELDVLAVHEATAAVLVLCHRDQEKRRRTVHFLSDTVALELEGGWAERNYTPLPERLAGTEACFKKGPTMCIDVTTGAQTQKPYGYGEPPSASLEEDGQEFAAVGDHVLLGTRDSQGPLVWAPQVRDKKVAP